jgi:3-phenylpropionate/trans-cinnamate dioxygenase ferredoxin subunit
MLWQEVNYFGMRYITCIHNQGWPMTWVDVAGLEELQDRDVLGAKLQGADIAIYRLEDGYFATQDICTHQFAFLSEGYVVDGCIECPLHQAMFDIRTGKGQGGLAKEDLKTYPVKIEDGRIWVRATDSYAKAARTDLRN